MKRHKICQNMSFPDQYFPVYGFVLMRENTGQRKPVLWHNILRSVNKKLRSVNKKSHVLLYVSMSTISSAVFETKIFLFCLQDHCTFRNKIRHF